MIKKDWFAPLVFNFYSKSRQHLMDLRWASHCFPSKKAGRQDFMHMIARPSINKDIKNRKTMRDTCLLQFLHSMFQLPSLPSFAFPVLQAFSSLHLHPQAHPPQLLEENLEYYLWSTCHNVTGSSVVEPWARYQEVAATIPAQVQLFIFFQIIWVNNDSKPFKS